MQIPSRTLFLGLGLTLCSSASLVQAAGFGLIENSASGMGNAFAGSAATAEDASTVWFNPAGMAELDDNTHVSAATHIILPKAKFNNVASRVNPALTGGSVSAAEAALTGSNSTSDKGAVVPNGYVVKSINAKTKVGLGVNAPFGLETNYDDDWYGRYHALKSDMKTVNINPSVSYKVNDKLSVGGGVSAQYIDVELTSAVDSAAVCRGIASAANSGTLLSSCLSALPKVADPSTDSKATIKGNDWSYNYNVGALYKPTSKTKVGVSYRSKMDHSLEGTAKYDVNARLQPILTATGVTRFNSADATAEANLPASLSVSVAHKLNDKVEVLGDITRTQWSSFEKLTVKNADTGAIITNVDENWKDVNRYSVGVNYQKNDRLKLRGGVAFDEEPIPDAQHRTARIPGNDRTWLSMGANYKLKKNMSMDVGYSHLFLDETPIDNTDESTGNTLRGNYDGSVNILSAQLNWSF